MTEPTTPKPPAVVRTPLQRIEEFFKNQRNGDSLEELADALTEVGQAVTAHNKAGKVQLTITMSPLKNVPGAMRVADTVKAVIPAEPKTESIFYAGSDGLSRTDPSQRLLDGMPGHSDVGVDPTVGLQRVERA